MSIRIRIAAIGAACAATAALAPAPASAQFWSYAPWYGSRQAYAEPYGEPSPYGYGYGYGYGRREARLRPGDVADLIRRYGWVLLGPPSLAGAHYVAYVRAGNGQRLYVVIDAYEGTVLRSRPIEGRPDTSQLAAIPEDGPAPPRYRHVAPAPEPEPEEPEPSRRAYHPPHHPAPVAKRVSPAPGVKSTPLPPPEDRDDIAVAKPTQAPPAAKPPLAPLAQPTPPKPATPTASVPTGSPPSASAPSGPAPTVRQVYPAPGDGPHPASPAAPPPSPQAATAAPQGPSAPVTPAVPAPKKPTPKQPGDKLPADAGFE